MKRNASLALSDHCTFGRPDADVRHLVTCYAAIRRCSPKRRVAGKAMVRDFGMGGDKRSWRDHYLRPCEDGSDDDAKTDGDQDESVPLFHFQPQNRKMEMMCANARTANASVIGT